MRLQLHLAPNTEPVPFNHLHQLIGALHKWLGPNNIHDGLSLYSFGWLKGAKRENGHLTFPAGAIWNVSFYEDDLAKKLIAGLMETPDIAYGLEVYEVGVVSVPDFSNRFHFRTDGSAIVVRQKRADDSREYLLWDNPIADKVLTQLMQKKLQTAGFTGDNLNIKIYFDTDYPRARTRKITIKGTDHKGSECPVWIEGTAEAISFAWQVGIGELTGSGFGALC